MQPRGAFVDLAELVRLNRPSQQLSLRTAPRRAAQLSGNWQSRILGRGLDFAEVREYQAGDDIRTMDWRVTARTGKAHTRLFTEERERPIILAADLRSPMFFGSQQCFKSVTAAGALSLLAWAAQQHRDRVGGLVIGDRAHREIRPKAGKRGVLSLLHSLEEFSHKLDNPAAEHEQSMEDLLHKLQRVGKPGSAIYLASDFHDFNRKSAQLLHQIVRHAQLTLLFISDPLEWQLPAGGSLWVTDGERRRRLQDSAQIEGILPARLATLHRHCDPLGIEVLPLSTADPLVTLMQRRFSDLPRKVG